MVERESDSRKKRVGGRENKGNSGGGTDEYLEEKTPVENKDFARVGRILDYGLRFREEEGWVGGKNKGQLRTGKQHRLKKSCGLILQKMTRIETTRREVHRIEKRMDNERKLTS